MATFRIACALAIAGSANGHFSLTDRSQIACDINAQEGINWLAMPILEGAPYSDWWMHGQVNCQSKARGVFELPAGGEVKVAMSSRQKKVPPPWGPDGGAWAPSDPNRILSTTEWGNGPDSRGNLLDSNHNIHAYERRDTSGCALAIAYKTKATDVTPSDFVVFSVLHDCPKRQLETFQVPNLPVCSGGNCICAWFWLPKNSGAKNFYMTPFVCKVTGAVGTSPVDVEYAIPGRRCLDPKLCNFGPRIPFYWLGAPSAQINAPEDTSQSPHYSKFYGFREGAQNDIFIATNPRRTPVAGFPAELKCSGAASRLTSTKTAFDLKSPNCACTAKLSGGSLVIKKGTTTVWSKSYASFGPDVVRNDGSQKASTTYFKRAAAPYRIDLNDKCYLALSDNNGMVLWESPFTSTRAQEYIVDAFKGTDPDPPEWNVVDVCTAAVKTACAAANKENCVANSARCGACKTGYVAFGGDCRLSSGVDPCTTCAAANKENCVSGSAVCGACKATFALSGTACVPQGDVAKCTDNYCSSWCNTPGKWGCGPASDGSYTCNCDKCTVGNGRLCNKEVTGATACDTAKWTQLKDPTGPPCPTKCQALVKTFPLQTCQAYCNLQGHTCEKAFEDAANTCTEFHATQKADCSTRFLDKYQTTDMICLCGTTRVPAALQAEAETAELANLHDSGHLAAFKGNQTAEDAAGSSAQAAAPAVALLASVFVLMQ